MVSAAAVQPARAPDPPAVPVLLVEPAVQPGDAVYGDMDTIHPPRARGGAWRVHPDGVPARQHGYRECVEVSEALGSDLTRLDREEVIRGLNS